MKVDRDVFYEKHDRVECELQDIGGMLQALEVCIRDHSALRTSDPQNRSINCLIYMISDKAQKASDLHQATWDAVMKPQNPPDSAI